MAALTKIIALFWLVMPQATFVSGEPAIKWSETHRLTWSDYRGAPDKTTGFAAITASGITYTLQAALKNDKVMVNCTVETFFYPEKSWYRKGEVNAVVLAHEQLHFDITELHTRKLKNAIDTAVFTENVKEEVRNLYEGILKELNAFQDRYDAETDYSRNLKEQLRWQQEIGEALRKKY